MRFYKVLYTGLFNRDTNIVLSFDKSYKSDFSFEKDRHDFEMSLGKFKIKLSCYRHETLSKQDNMVFVAEWFMRKVVVLVYAGSNPVEHTI